MEERDNMHFIYVMQKTDAEKLKALGYALINGSENKNIWIFENKSNIDVYSGENELTKHNIRYVLGNTLTF